MKFNESSTSDSCLHEFWCIWRMHHMSKSACTLRKCGSVRSMRFICLSSSVQNQHLANFSVLLCLGFFLWIVLLATSLTVELISASHLFRHGRSPYRSVSHSANLCKHNLLPAFHPGTAHCLLEFSGLDCCLFVKVLCCRFLFFVRDSFVRITLIKRNVNSFFENIFSFFRTIFVDDKYAQIIFKTTLFIRHYFLYT